MEPNKFEKYIKDKMQNWEIEPSGNAWERVSTQLEPSKPGNGFMWYAVAASFIGVLIVSVVFLRTNVEVVEPDLKIVDTGEKEIQEVQDRPKSEKQSWVFEQEKIKDGETVASSDENRLVKEKLNKTSFELQITDANSEEIDDGNKINISQELLESTDASIDLKINEVLQQVNLLEENKEQLTEAEVDSLLYAAQKEILKEKIFDRGSSVDAMALLNEVEGEIDRSFRDQIFNKLKSGFLRARTAVADRNN